METSISKLNLAILVATSDVKNNLTTLVTACPPTLTGTLPLHIPCNLVRYRSSCLSQNKYYSNVGPGDRQQGTFVPLLIISVPS